ncbi:cytochrome P450 [Fennellomyces sp. T-0311]|nr:cytochrome P450 [Fennellomyces sp. T-0311]
MPLTQSVISALSTVARSGHRKKILLGSITVAIYLVYEKILRPPSSLRHIPHMNFFMLFKAMVMRKSVEQVAKETYASETVKSSANGLYLRCDNTGWSVRLTRPVDVKFVLTKTDVFPKSNETAVNRRNTLTGRAFSPCNIFFVSGNEWRRQRKVINPAFHRAMPMNVYATVSEKAIAWIESDKPMDVHNLSQRWGLDIMGKTIFGYELNTLDDKQSEWVSRFDRISDVFQTPFYFVLPFVERNFKFLFPQLRKAHQEMTVYADMINGMVRQKREAMARGERSSVPDHEKDLLTLMIESSMKGQDCLSDEEFQANVFAFFLVGHNATAATMAHNIYYLAAHQGIQERARQEVIRAFGDEGNIQPTFEEMKKLPFLTTVIKEAMRLSTPVTHLTNRVAARDTEIAGTFIPKGTRIGITVTEIHCDPKIWKNPETFDPDRFAAGGEADQLEGFPWIPFGNGARLCVGMKSAITQHLVFLSMLLRQYKFHLPKDSIHKNGLVMDGFMALQPKQLQIIFEKRY